MLPKDPVILLSYLNTKLRDEYSSLAELCAALDADEAAVQETLAALERHQPLFAQAVPMTLEEIFIGEMEAAGYDCNDILS